MEELQVATPNPAQPAKWTEFAQAVLEPGSAPVGQTRRFVANIRDTERAFCEAHRIVAEEHRRDVTRFLQELKAALKSAEVARDAARRQADAALNEAKRAAESHMSSTTAPLLRAKQELERVAGSPPEHRPTLSADSVRVTQQLASSGRSLLQVALAELAAADNDARTRPAKPPSTKEMWFIGLVAFFVVGYIPLLLGAEELSTLFGFLAFVGGIGVPIVARLVRLDLARQQAFRVESAARAALRHLEPATSIREAELKKERDSKISEASKKHKESLRGSESSYRVAVLAASDSAAQQFGAIEARRSKGLDLLSTVVNNCYPIWRQGERRLGQEAELIDPLWDRDNITAESDRTAAPSMVRIGALKFATTWDLGELGKLHDDASRAANELHQLIASAVNGERPEEDSARTHATFPSVPKPASWSVPALIPFPPSGALLIKTSSTRRETAMRGIQDLVPGPSTSCPCGEAPC